MERDGISFIHSPKENLHYVGCKLNHLVSLTALGADPENYPSDHRHRMAEFLTCLMNTRDERFIYDLRIVADPDRDLYTRGKISLALLCRISDMSIDEAETYGSDLLNLMHCYFPECVFEPACIDTITWFLNPFPVRKLVAISRRASLERLDTLRGRFNLSRSLGFTSPIIPASPLPDAGMIFHVFPYIPSTALHNRLFKLLLLEKQPVAISCRIQPTQLSNDEEVFLEDQITQCERAEQAGIRGIPEDLSLLRPTLHEQAKLFQRYMTRMLYGLKDNAALMSLEIVSIKDIPIPLIDAIGNTITEPAGGMHTSIEDILERHLSGGYEVTDRSGDGRALSSFTSMEIHNDSSPLPPLRKGCERLPFLFDSIEASTAFRLPMSTLETPVGIPAQSWRSKPPPKELPETGRLVGLNIHGGTVQNIRLGDDDRRRHLYVVGQTGTGKTTLLKTMILEDIRAGEGLCVIDPHGDMFREILGKIPPERMEDVVVLDPTDREYPVGINLLEYEHEDQRHFIVQEFSAIITRMMEDEYGHEAQGMMGPVFWQQLKMNLLLTMSNPEDPGTLLEFYNIFQEDGYWRRWIPLRIKDPMLEKWVRSVLPVTDFLHQPKENISMGAYLSSKIEGFLFDPLLRQIFGQKRSTLNVRQIMDERKILLVNLAKGELSTKTSQFFGMVLLGKIMAAALTRVSIPDKDRRNFYLYVDEFQSFATEGFITLLSEGRKFGVSLVMANQFISQIKDKRITDSIFGNVGTTIGFRVGHEDAEMLEKMFFPVFNRFDFGNLPNWHAYMRTLIDNQSSPPFSFQTKPDATPADVGRALEVRNISRSKYSQPKDIVDMQITASLKPPVKR